MSAIGFFLIDNVRWDNQGAFKAYQVGNHIGI